jgi:ABC-type cobalamin/Fe3+-siderophores transport system ATPase subunit
MDLKEIKISIVSWRNNKIYSDDSSIDFYLEQDSWNDYGFFTLYHFHIGGKYTSNNSPLYIGDIRIQKKGQQVGEKFLLDKNIHKVLPIDFISYTSDIDFYLKLNKMLPFDVRYSLAYAMNMVVLDASKYEKEMKDDECYNTSLTEGNNIDISDAQIAKDLLIKEGKIFYDVNKDIKLHLKNINDPLELNFGVKNNAPKDIMPNRMCVIIGRNGCGKSTVIYRLCRLLAADVNSRSVVKDDIGFIEPSDVFFTKVIMFSYNSLDNFTLPINSDSDVILGRFIYCGLRDVKQEGYSAKDKTLHYKERICIEDRQNINVCKGVEFLAKEFVTKFSAICSNKYKQSILTKSINIIEAEESCISIGEELKKYNPQTLLDKLSVTQKEQLLNYFLNLSTGHKFILHSLVHLIDLVQPSSIAIFDEPENHLHPPLLAVYMKAIRYILKKRNAVMLVATHSPVILQETLASNAIIIRKDGNIISLGRPPIQTFGENLDRINAEVFSLTQSLVDYREVLNNFLLKYKDINPYEIKSTNDISDIINGINVWLDGGLSNQATAYLINKLYRELINQRKNVEH